MKSRTGPLCRSCKYHGVIGGDITCDYILIVHHSRGCPAGPGCIRYERGIREKVPPIPVPSIETMKARAKK